MVQHTGEHYTTVLADSVIGTRAFTLDNNLFGLRNYDGGWKMAKDATQPADNNLGLITPPKPRPSPSKTPPAPLAEPKAAAGESIASTSSAQHLGILPCQWVALARAPVSAQPSPLLCVVAASLDSASADSMPSPCCRRLRL